MSEIQPIFVDSIRQESPTTDLIAGYGFNCYHRNLMKDINKTFHLCSITTISDTQTRYIFNQGQNPQEVRCALYLSLVIVSKYDIDVDKAWQAGLEKIIEETISLCSPRAANLEGNDENKKLIEKLLKYLITDYLYIPNPMEDINNQKDNLKTASSALKKIVDLEDKGFFSKIRNKNEINLAKKYTEAISQKLQILDQFESEVTPLRPILDEFLKRDTLLPTDFQTVQDTLKTLWKYDYQKLDQTKTFHLFYDALKLAKTYDIHFGWKSSGF